MNADLILSILKNIFLIAGAFFMFLAGLGIATLPDVFIRLHANTKSATLGAGLILIGAIIHFGGETAMTTRLVLLLLFIFATAPVAGHMIGRAAYFSDEAQLWEHTLSDALKGNYDPLTHEVKSPEAKIKKSVKPRKS